MSSSRSNTNDDHPSVVSVRSSESPPVTGTKEHTQLGTGRVSLLSAAREKKEILLQILSEVLQCIQGK